VDHSTVATRFAETIALHEAGVAMMRLNLARRHPGLTDEEIDDLLKAWLSDRPMDAPGRLVHRTYD
jgi:hypothetical protein